MMTDKPEPGIPADVMEAADALSFEFAVADLEKPAKLAIARAIMAERERCAKIADEFAASDMHLRDLAKTAKDATGVFVHAAEAATGKAIAAAIRLSAPTKGAQDDR